MFYKDKEYLRIAIKKNSICRSCVNTITKTKPLNLETKRNCPKCNSEITHKGNRSHINAKNAELKGAVCVKCYSSARIKELPKDIAITQDGRFNIKCSKCGLDIFSKRKDTILEIHKKKGICYPCAIKNPIRAAKLKKYYQENKEEMIEKIKAAWKNPEKIKRHRLASTLAWGKPENKKKLINAIHSPEARKKFLDANSIYTQSEDFKQKQRNAYLLRIENKYSKVYPNYNKAACYIFDEINKELGWEGVYAENGGEYRCIGWFLDYYEPILNVAIEFDEKHHRYSLDKDKARQERIIKHLGCTFFRIKQGEDWRNTLLPELLKLNAHISLL